MSNEPDPTPVEAEREADTSAQSMVDASAPLELPDGLAGYTELLLIIGSIPFWGIVMYYAYSQLMPRGQFGAAFLGGILVLYVVMEIAGAVESRDYLDIGALVSSAVVAGYTCVYLFTNYDQVAIDAVGTATEFEIRLAAAFTLVMIYLTWRAFGPTFLAVVLAGIGYGLAGPWMPGVLSHGGLSIERTLRILVVSVDGFFGFLTQLVAAWIALFLLYAGLLKAYGAFELILRLAVQAAKYIDSGIAQTAVVASTIIGSVNGSQTANAGMTGSFTIPLMKRSGVKSETAGGIEAVASTSGQVLPPVMGAGAFIMAQLITGITYFDVIVAGLIPAVILVVATVIAVHYVAAPQIDDPEMAGAFETKLTRPEIVLEGIKYGAPLAVLIWALGIRQVTVMSAALWTVSTMFATGIAMPVVKSLLVANSGLEDNSDEGPGAALTHSLKQTIDGFREGVVVLAPVAIILGSINGVVDILVATGVPGSISLALIDLSGGNMLIGVILAMIICIVLGLGMPTTAAYTVVALLIQPTLENQFFIPEFASHFFVFYAAILAGLTPPIATCVAVTCGISGGGFWRSCKESLRISAPLFVLPFAFVYNPELVGGALTTSALSAGGLALFGAVAIIHGINYQFSFGRPVTYAARLAFFGLGIVAMVHPNPMLQGGAVAAVALVYAVQVTLGRPDPMSTIRGTIDGINRRRAP